MAAGLEGYLKKNMIVAVRVIFVSAGLLLIIPSLVTDAVGIVLMLFVILWQLFIAKNEEKKAKVVTEISDN